MIQQVVKTRQGFSQIVKAGAVLQLGKDGVILHRDSNFQLKFSNCEIFQISRKFAIFNEKFQFSKRFFRIFPFTEFFGKTVAKNIGQQRFVYFLPHRIRDRGPSPKKSTVLKCMRKINGHNQWVDDFHTVGQIFLISHAN